MVDTLPPGVARGGSSRPSACYKLLHPHPLDVLIELLHRMIGRGAPEEDVVQHRPDAGFELQDLVGRGRPLPARLLIRQDHLPTLERLIFWALDDRAPSRHVARLSRPV